jgi:hypothetical protein
MNFRGPPFRVRADRNKPYPEILHPGDAIVRVTCSCICGCRASPVCSELLRPPLWPQRPDTQVCLQVQRIDLRALGTTGAGRPH